ncbi:MAG TPA: SAM-dependent chlorinase/fluorinase [Chloroflexota bacterium]|nr:SAM-dependent chlorinase/fluorinase [Chloroflexota bacterium]
MRPVIALLTDFGLEDHYVGVMKAVIAGIAPEANVVDISHAVPPQAILAGQRLLQASVPYLPDGAIVLAVVDPGVGSERRPMALRSGRLTFVGPDNGLFTPWLPGEVAVELTAPEFRLPEVSATFHGRDVFAPAAAHLAAGVPLEKLGPKLADSVRLDPPRPRTAQDGTIQGEVVYVDHFDNLITNIGGVRGGTARIRGHDLPVQATYSAVNPGELLALIGSDGALEVAMRNGSAAAYLSAEAGEPVTWRPR